MGEREQRIDEYVERTIGSGDAISAELARLFGDTLRHPSVDVISSGKGGMAVVRTQDDEDVVGFAAAGASNLNGYEHGVSLVRRLMESADRLGVRPIGFANVIDSRHEEWERVRPLAEGMRERALKEGVAVLNGEYAILGERVADANAMGVMIATIPRSRRIDMTEIPFARFSHDGLPITINADGVGTKTELYERTGRYGEALKDFLAMNLDDTSKFGGVARAVLGVMERRGDIPRIDADAKRLEQLLGFPVRIQHEDAGERIASYRDGVAAYNLSGAVISTVNEARLRNPPRSEPEDYLVGVRNSQNPNPRSNGISRLRTLAWQSFGHKPTDDWHLNPEAKDCLRFLAAPSTIFYPLFNEVLQDGSATAVYHMSGGAFDGKLAKPLAENGLHATLDNLFTADPCLTRFAEKGGIGAKDAYKMWHMGTEALVSTKNPRAVIAAAKERGYDARIVGQISASDGRAGATLTAFNGERVEYLYDAA